MNLQKGGGATRPVVLLAATANFAVDYVASVLKGRNIWVIGPLGDLSQAIHVLSTEDIRGVILIDGFPAQDHARLVDILTRRTLPYLTVRSGARSDQEEEGAVLFPPFAAYQVADWVAGLP